MTLIKALIGLVLDYIQYSITYPYMGYEQPPRREAHQVALQQTFSSSRILIPQRVLSQPRYFGVLEVCHTSLSVFRFQKILRTLCALSNLANIRDFAI